MGDTVVWKNAPGLTYYGWHCCLKECSGVNIWVTLLFEKMLRVNILWVTLLFKRMLRGQTIMGDTVVRKNAPGLTYYGWQCRLKKWSVANLLWLVWKINIMDFSFLIWNWNNIQGKPISLGIIYYQTLLLWNKLVCKYK